MRAPFCVEAVRSARLPAALVPVMAHPVLGSLATRFGAGHGLWSIVAFLFPMLAVVKDDSVAMAMLLFLLETLMASAVLVVRLSASRRAARDDHEARRRLGEAIRMVQFFVLPFSLGCAVLLGAVTFIEVEKGRAAFDAASHLDRAKWMTLSLFASAGLDSIIAPIRSVTWLETGVSWQGSRTAVMILVVLLGWPVMLFTGTTQSFFWTFFGLRLLSDLGSLRPAERERIRAQMFGEPFNPGVG
jgi:hypothetical protein